MISFVFAFDGGDDLMLMLVLIIMLMMMLMIMVMLVMMMVVMVKLMMTYLTRGGLNKRERTRLFPSNAPFAFHCTHLMALLHATFPLTKQKFKIIELLETLQTPIYS